MDLYFREMGSKNYYNSNWWLLQSQEFLQEQLPTSDFVYAIPAFIILNDLHSQFLTCMDQKLGESDPRH